MGAALDPLPPLNLRYPEIPRAERLPAIAGPRGGPAYRPHPDDAPPQASARPEAAPEPQPPRGCQNVESLVPFTLAGGFAAVLLTQVLGLF